MPQLTIVETSSYLELLVGEMPAEPCESNTHDPADQFHDDGPATHYARLHCPNCLFAGIKGYCDSFTEAIRALPNFTLRCTCGHKAPAEEMVTILGPVGKLP